MEDDARRHWASRGNLGLLVFLGVIVAVGLALWFLESIPVLTL